MPRVVAEFSKSYQHPTIHVSHKPWPFVSLWRCSWRSLQHQWSDDLPEWWWLQTPPASPAYREAIANVHPGVPEHLHSTAGSEELCSTWVTFSYGNLPRLWECCKVILAWEDTAAHQWSICDFNKSRIRYQLHYWKVMLLLIGNSFMTSDICYRRSP